VRRPLLFLAIPFALGCQAGTELPRGAAATLLAVSAALLALGLAARGRWAAIALAAAGLGIGAAAASVGRAAHETAPLLAWCERTCGEGPLRLEGFAVGDASEEPDRQVLTLDVRRAGCAGREAEVHGRVRVDVAGRAARAEVRDGDRVAVWATLRAPRGASNPGSQDGVARARRAAIHGYGYAKSAGLVEVLERGAASRPRASMAAARAWSRRQLSSRLPPGPEEALTRAMVLGDRSGLDPQTEEAFRASGTYHVLAISGAQVALLAALLTWPLRRAGVLAWPSALAASALLCLYALFVGGEVPVVRATCMALAVLLGMALDVAADLANLVGFAGLVLLTHQPFAIADPSFQLSFAATLGILLLTPVLLAHVPKLPLRAEMAVAASLAAQASLAPILALHFTRLAPAALFLNLAAVPLSGVVMVAGLATLLLAPAPPLADLAAGVAWCAAHALLLTGRVVELWPALEVRVAPPTAWVWIVHAAALWALLEPRLRRQGAVLLALSMGGLVFGPGGMRGDGRLHATILDVGQGDAIVLVSPEGRVWLVDAGGGYTRRFDPGEFVVAPFLWSLGARRIERLLISHAHPDHSGGVPFLLGAFAVGEVWEGPAPSHDAGYETLDRALREAGVPRRTAVAGLAERWDGVEVRVLGPAAPPGPPWRTRNDHSLVLWLRLGSVSLLLPGDVEAAGEGCCGDRRSDVVKVPHHGSRTSSTPAFLAGTRPRLAIVSVGDRNPFGHPHPEVVERYRQRQALVLRTDRDGAIQVSTDGSRLWVQTQKAGVSLIR
jgi:competence protein ComEC